MVSACSDDGGGPDVQTPLPQSPSVPQESVSANPGLPHSGAPKVAAPIADTSTWESDPCTMLSAEQIQSLGMKPPEPKREDQQTGPGCYWEFDAESVSGFSADIATAGGGQGISNLYQHKEQGTAKVFEELPAIEGHPAVVAMAEDARGDGECSVAVGLRDDLVMGVTMTADPSIEQGKDPCGWAVKLATAAVQTMKGSA